MTPAENPGTWEEQGTHVISELKRLDKCIEAQYEKIEIKLDNIRNAQEKLSIQVAMLNVKSGIWGFMAGLVPAVVALIYFIVKK